MSLIKRFFQPAQPVQQTASEQEHPNFWMYQ